MTQKPLVSVCMITYNHEAYIAQAIEGVLMQKTDFPIELVIGEDCSTDSTREICQRFETETTVNVSVLSREKNLGVMPNLVDTLKHCHGKYIALCEGDDYWSDVNKLSMQIGFLERNPKYTGACTSVDRLDERDHSVRPEQSHDLLPSEMDVTTEELLSDFFIYTPTFVFRNHIFEAENLSRYSFGDKFIQLLTSAKGMIRFFNCSSSVYRIHNSGAMHTFVPANPYRFFGDYIDFLTFYDEYTSFEFHPLISRKQTYLCRLKSMSDRSNNIIGRSIAGIRYLLDSQTEKSIGEVRNVFTLTFPQVHGTVKRIFKK